jgi:hypothetical protein
MCATHGPLFFEISFKLNDSERPAYCASQTKRTWLVLKKNNFQKKEDDGLVCIVYPAVCALNALNKEILAAISKDERSGAYKMKNKNFHGY